MIFKKKTGEFKGVRYEENKYLTDTLISKNLNECLINQTPECVKKPQTLIRNCDQFTLIHEKRSSKIRPPNFNKEQLEVLMDWLENNSDNPFPSKSNIRNIRMCTGLSIDQIKLWCTNIRRRKLRVYKEEDGTRTL